MEVGASMNKLYPYPAVQYIPLPLEIFFQYQCPFSGPFLLVEKEISLRKEQIQEKFGVQLPALPFVPHSLILFFGGIKPQEIKYRGYYVTIKAEPEPALYLGSIPKHYFYKKTLVFQAKNENGEILCSKLYNLESPTRVKVR